MRAHAPPARVVTPGCLALALLVAGCAHSSRAERVRLTTLREALEARTFPLRPAEARARLQALGEQPEAGVSVPVEEACDAAGCRLRLGRPGRDEVLLALTEAPAGATRVDVVHALPLRGRLLLARVWRTLDGRGLAEAQEAAARAGEVEALEEWRSFRPRWGLTGAAFFASGSSHAGVGARVGVRRWQEPHVLTGALLEAEWGQLRTSERARTAPVGLLSLPLRVELAPWTEFSEASGLPEASLSLLAGPSLLLAAPGEPEARPGLRAGVGVQLLHASDGVTLPLLLEMHLQQHALRGGLLRDLRVVVGVGF